MNYFKQSWLLFIVTLMFSWAAVSFELIYLPVSFLVTSFMVYIIVPIAICICIPKLLKKKSGGNRG
ncbi:ACR3 family arsenite efflux pump ArsB [Providencia alcalifaciens]|nr:ACR3 family arsenite efflux pump ArsB [Providencia alcalifaciens]